MENRHLPLLQTLEVHVHFRPRGHHLGVIAAFTTAEDAWEFVDAQDTKTPVASWMRGAFVVEDIDGVKLDREGLPIPIQLSRT